MNTEQQEKYRNSWAQLHLKPPPIHHKTLNKDNELATFTISSDATKTKNKSKTLGRWVKPGELIQIKDVIIKGGYFFLGTQLQAPDHAGSEPSLINDCLEIEKETLLFQDSSLNYWPKFIYLSPKARGAYLDWLASSRDNVATHIGYVFIYFYGIERRIVVDSLKNLVANNEFIALFNEVKRLQSIYKARSFFHYSTRLLELMCLLRPGLVRLEIPNFVASNDSLLFKYQLAVTVKAGKPLPFELAFAWLKYYPEYTSRTPAIHCENKFYQLFKIRYHEELKEGIVVNCCGRTRLTLNYSPANSTLRILTIDTKRLVDPSVLNEPINKIMTIADACTDELAPLSRYLHKAGTSVDDLAALLLFPDTLLNTKHSTLINRFNQWVEKKNRESSGVVSVSEFWLQMGLSLPLRIKKNDIVIMQQLARKIGYAFAPDQIIHHAKPTANGMIVLFQNQSKQFFKPSTAFNEIRILLQLASIVHDHSRPNNISLLQEFINNEQQLSLSEKHSLHAYLLWCINTPKNIIGLKAELNKIESNVKNTMAHILVSIILSYGKLLPIQIKHLEKLYTMLGLEKKHVTADIYNASLKQTVVTTLTSAKKLLSDQCRKRLSSDFKLDDIKMSVQQNETKEVQSILGKIFIDEDEVSNDSMRISSLPEKDNDSLDPTHNRLLLTLMNKEKWTRTEIEDLCRSFGVMVDGAIETINDWSFDAVDAAVLENEGDVYVHQSIANELKILQGSL